MNLFEKSAHVLAARKEFLRHAVRFVDERASVAALEDLVIVAARGGAELRLSDLGRVTDRFELAEDKIVLNGRRAALLNVDKTKD